MSSDKISKVLEKQLKVLGQTIRIDILKKLHRNHDPLSFSNLQREVLGNNPTSTNFSFHLNALKKNDLISSTSDGYYLTNLGKKILENILSIEQVLNDQNKTIMIRTSKYSKEPFNENKIEEYLIVEGEMEAFLAKKIAKEVKNRLFKANVEYLTAPLMREYINAILLENGLEEVRHRLTRLGTPPYEAFKLFNSQENVITPEKFLKKLGSDVSEQFLLLNLLPNDLADLYLSGEIALLHLNHWSLRPLSFYLNTGSILNIISKREANLPKKISKSRDYIRLILSFIEQLTYLHPYVSEDLLLGDFNRIFLSNFKDLEKEKTLFNFDIITSQISQYSERFEDHVPHISLNFDYNDLNDDIFSQVQIDDLFLNQLSDKVKNSNGNSKPIVLFDYSNFQVSNLTPATMIMKENVIFYNHRSSNLINSSVVKVNNSKENYTTENKIVLDKILINLDLIAKEASQQDDVFCDLLHDRINSAFIFFAYKESLVKKKLNSIKNWRSLYSQVFADNFDNWTENAIKSISFFGLNEATKHHCGIELDRIDKSESFALKIVSLMKNIIDEKNDDEGSNFILSQPHYANYSSNSYTNGRNSFGKNIQAYSPKIIRKDTNLPLKKQIAVFKKFEDIINGGVMFNSDFNPKETTLEDHLKALFESKLHAFSIKNSTI